MKAKLFLLMLLMLILFINESLAQNPNFAYPFGYTKNAYVAQVIDGDTFVLSDSQHVRILGIDCPEIQRLGKPAEPFADEASAITKSLIEHKTVKLTFEGRAFDIFGRLLAYVWLTNSEGKDSVFVQAELLKAGLARISYYTKEKRYYDLFYILRNTARRKKLGTWSRE